jgi:2-polyprenyl-6-methoxyphenol hydroxylase-like FAD-dependent oxidoreductase
VDNILIVGAGPTGLVLALALLQRGISVRLIDEKPGPSIHSKAFGIHARTLEILAKLGVVSSFLEKGNKAHAIIFHREKKECIFKLEEKYLKDTPYPFVLMLPQSETEHILGHEVLQWGGRVEWKTKLIGIENGTAILSTGERLNFNWLIGCDGGRSTVRHLLKIPFEGVEFSETFLIVDIEGKSEATMPSPHFFFSKQGLAGLIAFKPELNRVILPLKADEEIEENLSAIQSELKKRGCGEFFIPEEIKWFSHFKIHRRMVNKLREGNCLLAGDAAHIHSPVGGQGMNTSIQDAFNLAWKLSQVIKGISPSHLINSFELERLPVAKKVLKGTTAFTRVLNFVQKTGFFPLFFFILFLIRKFFRKAVTRGLTELSLTYKKSLYIEKTVQDFFWKGPKAGERAPNVILKNKKNFFEYLNHPESTLLIFHENERLEGKGYKLLVLNDPNLMSIYHACEKSIYFIRPDGVIGYRRHRIHVKKIQQYLLKMFS